MNLYPSKDVLDIDAAVVELKHSGSMTSESARRAVVAAINTAALLDVASSLRIIAAEALAAMGETDEPDEVDAPAPADDDFIVEGDLVAVDGLDDPAEVLRFGFTEGAAYAMVRLPDGTEAKAWLDTLHRLVGDERDDDTMRDASEIVPAERVIAMAGGVPLAEDDVIDDIDDDIDDDFDGDSHEAAASALDLLKANEAARKAGKKKGKKS